MKPTICLGTAQFGQVYGITNKSGQVPEQEVRRLLVEAQKSGITFLDRRICKPAKRSDKVSFKANEIAKPPTPRAVKTGAIEIPKF